MKPPRVTIITRRKSLCLRWRDPTTGKMAEETTDATSKREARALASLKEEELRNRPSGFLEASWQEFRRRYAAEKLVYLSFTASEKASSVLDAFEASQKPSSVSGVTASHISGYARSLAGLANETIRGYLARLKAALNWAKGQGLLLDVPHVAMPPAPRGEVMKGRPITTEEFERMLGAVERLFGEEAESYENLLRGLWTSGLRLGEALSLRWEQHDGLWLDFSGRRPMLSIPAHAEKGRRNRLCPIAPEFAEFLDGLPFRTGAVFDVPGSLEDVSKSITRIGTAANVVVNIERGKTKYASAHDLRRSFGERWAMRVQAPVLMQLMRHESIQTTMRYYVGRNAQATAEVLWRAVATDPSRISALPS